MLGDESARSAGKDPGADPWAVALRCLGGRVASPQVRDDAVLLLQMSTEARDRLWSILGPCLARELPDDLDW